MPGTKLGATVAALIMIGGTAAIAAPKAASTQKAAPSPTDVVATVNGEKITRGEVSTAAYNWYGAKVVDGMIQDKLIMQEAKKAGVTVDDAAVKGMVEKSLSQFGSNKQDRDAALARAGMTMERLTQAIRMQMLAEATVRKSIKVTPQEIDSYRNASHILLATNNSFSPDNKPLTDEEKAKADADVKAKIEGIAKEIAGGLSFADAAKKYSDDNGSKVEGGELGWFEASDMDPAFSEGLLALQKVGDISGPVKSRYGYHLIRLTGIGSQASAAERKEIEQTIINRKMGSGMNEWFRGVLTKAKITNTLGPVIKPQTPAKPKASSPAKPKTAKPADGQDMPPVPPTNK